MSEGQGAKVQGCGSEMAGKGLAGLKIACQGRLGGGRTRAHAM